MAQLKDRESNLAEQIAIIFKEHQLRAFDIALQQIDFDLVNHNEDAAARPTPQRIETTPERSLISAIVFTIPEELHRRQATDAKRSHVSETTDTKKKLSF